MTRHTKVMATIATLKCTPEFISELRNCGAAGFRINSAHVGPEELVAMVNTIRSVDPSLCILMDTKGPELRTTPPAAPFELQHGACVTLRQGSNPSTAELLCSPAPICDMKLLPGHTLLIDDGAALLEIIDANADEIHARVMRGTTIDAAKTVSSPEVDLPDLPAVSERDRVNIIAACEAGIDIIAHSFVRSAADVEAVRTLIDGSNIQLYAKIECRPALQNLDEIISAADAILIARGDLGTQIPLWEIPVQQQRITSACNDADTPIMIATQMLESMTHSPLPTRAELSDVALGVMQGAEWLLLCGETARGEYPAECIQMMSRIIEATEKAGLCTTKL